MTSFCKKCKKLQKVVMGKKRIEQRGSFPSQAGRTFLNWFDTRLRQVDSCDRYGTLLCYLMLYSLNALQDKINFTSKGKYKKTESVKI